MSRFGDEPADALDQETPCMVRCRRCGELFDVDNPPPSHETGTCDDPESNLLWDLAVGLTRAEFGKAVRRG